MVFIAKVFINVSFLNVYQAAFNEDIIFPFYNRVTSTGICNFIARLLTVFAPLVAEMDRPIPAIFILSINSLALLSCIWLPTWKEEEAFEEKYKFKSKSKVD